MRAIGLFRILRRLRHPGQVNNEWDHVIDLLIILVKFCQGDIKLLERE